MSTQIEPLEVTVTGGTAETNTLVYGIVQTALDDAGFTDIIATSPHAEAVCESAQMPSLLDLVRLKNPSMFDTPVRVSQHLSADAAAALPNAGAVAAAIAATVYGGVLDESVAAEAAMVFISDDGTPVEEPEDIPF
jgi:hypothetical protein